MNRNKVERFYLMGNLKRSSERCERRTRHVHYLKMADGTIVIILYDRQIGIVVMEVMTVQRLTVQHATHTMFRFIMATTAMVMVVECFHSHHHAKRHKNNACKEPM